jgi:hypothetical protein
MDLLLLALGVAACLAATPFLIILADFGVSTTVCTILLGAVAGLVGAVLGVLTCAIVDKAPKRKPKD